MLDYLKYPVWTLWSYLTNPLLAARNTRIVLAAFWRTLYLGRRAVGVLKRRKDCWSERTRGRYIWRVAQRFWAGWIVSHAEVELSVTGRGRVDWSHPHVVVANHQSTLDVLLVIALVDSGRFVAKQEILPYPVIGSCARYGGQIVIDRSDHRQSMRVIRRGMEVWPDSNLIFFAEGTRSRSGRLGEFKRGAFAIARETGLPILPVAITGTFEALPKGSLLHLRRRPRVHVEFGEEIAPEGDVPALAQRTHDVIASMIAHRAHTP